MAYEEIRPLTLFGASVVTTEAAEVDHSAAVGHDAERAHAQHCEKPQSVG